LYQPRHERLVALLERMLELDKKTSVEPPSRRHSRQDAGATLSGKLAPSQVERVDREIASTDAEVDEVVHKPCGMRDEERRIIEGA